MKPGGLAVSRAFGDLKSKNECGALICTPDIKQFTINKKIDFICIGSIICNHCYRWWNIW